MTLDPRLVGLTPYDFTVEFSASSKVAPLEPSDEAILWGAALVIEPESGRLVLATAELVVVRFRSSLPLDVLDDFDADLARFMPLFGPDGVEFDERYEFEGLHDGLVVANRVAVPPEFRGHGFGPLLLVHALQTLAGDCGVAAGEPAPFELEADDPAYEGEKRRLQRLWTEFGFTIWDNGLATIDLATNTLRTAADAMSDRLEILLAE